MVVHSLASASSSSDEQSKLNLEAIIDITEHSSKRKLLRITGVVLKFIALLKRGNNQTKELNGGDLMAAEDKWVMSIQRHAFTEEYQRLACGKTVVYRGQFNLYLNDKRLICCKGHLGQANLPHDMKYPVLLPTKHHFTNLLILDRHKKVHHNGIADTLASIRENYWICRGREAVKKVIRRCVTCRRFEGKSYKPPLVPDLPPERVSEDPPFSNVGIDFAGPLYVRNKEGQECKTYICLLTCATTRAVHLEVTCELSAAAFLLAFRRFCGRRGVPTVIFSDNAKTKHYSKEIKGLTRPEEVHQYLTNQHIRWNFIVEKAPWWGGFWERLVKGVKRCLKKTIGRSTLTLDELTTIMIEIEATLNNRPLTYVHDDSEGISHTLTPADLIYGRRVATTPSGRQFDITSTNKTLTKRAKYQFRMLSNFTKQWQRDYLLSLQERRSVKTRSGVLRQIQIGDIVVLRDDGTARCLWKLAKVTETING